MTKLADLEPRFFRLEEDGPAVGLTFLCPHCRQTRLGIAFHHRGHEAIEDKYILARHGAADANHIWTLTSAEDINLITVDPSIDASQAGHWHGFLRDGAVSNL